MNTFKLSSKKIYNDTRSSIDNLHDEKIKTITDYYSTLDDKKYKLINLIEIYNVLVLSKDSEKIEQKYNINLEINKLKDEISDIENQTELLDYLSNAKEFLENMNNESQINESQINESQINESQINESQINESQISSGSILNFVSKTGKTNRGTEYTNYVNKCVNNTVINLGRIKNGCKQCGGKQDIDNKESLLICTDCGVCEKYMDNSNNFNYSETTQIDIVAQPFSYQRKNHFKEWLNQLQAKEVTQIPAVVIELLFTELKKDRINENSKITSERIKSYLKKLKLNKYYEHIPNIISKITNIPPLKISKEFEEILLGLFDKIQEPFKLNCPKERKNFLSYSYTLHKFCQLLKKDEYLIYFPLLKSREKLFEQEKIWKGICKELNWTFIASI